jgi:hypothetical protein
MRIPELASRGLRGMAVGLALVQVAAVQRLFCYNAWANGELSIALATLDGESP